MSVFFQINIAAAAAEAGGCGFDCDPRPLWEIWLEMALESLLVGVILLPLSYLFVWLLHRAKLDRWVLLNALFAAILTLVIYSFILDFVFVNFDPIAEVGVQLGLNVFGGSAVAMLLVILLGSAMFGWWLKRRRQRQESAAVFEEFQ